VIIVSMKGGVSPEYLEMLIFLYLCSPWMNYCSLYLIATMMPDLQLPFQLQFIISHLPVPN